MYILFPCAFNNLLKADDDYEYERKVAEEYNHTTLLFNYDDYILMNRPLIVTQNFNKPIKAIYRGWMMKPDIYNKFYNDLLKLNIQLINSPQEYENAHCFNNSYKLLCDYTPKSIFFDKDETIDFDVVKNTFSHWIMKDYVKSVKGFDFPTSFNNSMTNDELEKYVNKFIELRDDLYTGGICFKQYVDLKWKDITHEFRAFYYNGILKVMYCNSKNNEDTIPKNFASKVPRLDSNFYTIDFALLENGDVIVIETGDGQVSGIENDKAINTLYEKLKNYDELCFFANMTSF